MKSTTKKLLIAGGVIVGGVILWKLLGKSTTTTTTTTPATSLPSPSGSLVNTSNLTTLANALKGLFSGSAGGSTSSSSSSSSSGSSASSGSDITAGDPLGYYGTGLPEEALAGIRIRRRVPLRYK